MINPVFGVGSIGISSTSTVNAVANSHAAVAARAALAPAFMRKRGTAAATIASVSRGII